MVAKLILPAVLLFLSSNAITAQSVPSVEELPKFMSREVTITEPERDADGFFPKGPASVCIEGPPQRQCYTAPKEFGNNPTVALIDLDKYTPALFFSAASGGISGWQVHLLSFLLERAIDLRRADSRHSRRCLGVGSSSLW